ncbi:MAG TPA: DUF6569 family protein [Gammaproteobacteria bacterium]|nr:DUF6569 family protein [Gammaproteobacteria bacterium]
MLEEIRQHVTHVRVRSPQTYRNLSVFPLQHQADSELHYLTLAEALLHGKGAFTIKEVSGAGSVPELLVANGLKEDVLILEGEELIGAKQNRVPNLTLLVPAGTEVRLPVSCVEAGRWSYATPEFTEAPRTQFASGRARKVASVSMSMRHSGLRHSDQGEVWGQIAEKAASLGTHSPTAAMSDMYRDRQPQLEDYAAALREATSGAHGAAFAVGARIIGLDIFDRAATCEKLAGKVLAGYALEAVSEPCDKAFRVPTPAAVRRLLADLTSGEIQSYPALGAGTDLRFSGRDSVGGGLFVDNALVHLAAFPAKRASMGPGHTATDRARRYGGSNRSRAA